MSASSFLSALKSSLSPDVEVEWKAETGSTNDDLKARAHAKAFTGPVLLTVDRQTAGRGTHGRVWRPMAGTLIFSVGLPVTRPFLSAAPGIVSIIAAMAVAKAASQGAREKVLVKWPNDIWTAGGKAGGILIETVTDRTGARSLIIGCGLNLAVEPGGRTGNGWPITAITPRVSVLSAEMRGELLGLIVSELLAQFASVRSTQDFARLIERWPLYDAFHGRTVVWSTPDEPGHETAGIDRGIDATGRLIIEGRRGEWSALSGELISLLGEEKKK
ncbi:biotin--[acetyl-CoA-carboxylase] ligase [Sutterella sp.]|uniref:biotin--[acetyl-CoA-carboxylase] ligase n=1 Tax=Sutterella sp. TaxID=1981025 RepID=UPI0026E0EA73|nr:biotin--[acetyl-CoA-carboxylase] ligase [Sutterella sp.]MDO5530422.1 biotin--[acetyl-CoA-carboxylase] ligase [Sutterella sp.]